MRNSAGTLGLIAGLIGIIVGFIGYGSVEISERVPELTEQLGWFENPGYIQFVSFIAPLLAIAGGAMARNLALVGGALMLASCAAFYSGFGFNIGTMFPIGFAGVGGILAIASRRPDAPQSH